MTVGIRWGRHPASRCDTHSGCFSPNASHPRCASQDGRRFLLPAPDSQHGARPVKQRRHSGCTARWAAMPRAHTGATEGSPIACTCWPSRQRPPGGRTPTRFAAILPGRLVATLGARGQGRDQWLEAPLGPAVAVPRVADHPRLVTRNKPAHWLISPGRSTGREALPPPPPPSIARCRATRTACRQPP